MKYINIILRISLILLVLYSIISILFVATISFLSQSPHQKEHLTFFNHILPAIITIIFMIVGTFKINYKTKVVKRIKKQLLLSSIIELFAVKWQIEYLIWATNTHLINNLIPIIISLAMVTVVITKYVVRLIEESRINN